ncbi:hypothetical protein CRENBAI_003034 [Crenichthys baileyi]|uniref:Uncharacterized protein n=1 Tax=Crenichthys baileyi TaxID=28760 RepID=A0AAV9RW87_9TELE
MGQTKSGSRILHEDKYIEARDVARYGGSRGPPWSQAWGRDSSGERLVAGVAPRGTRSAKPERETRGHPPVGPTTCRGNREGPVQRGLGGGRRWRPQRPDPRMLILT